MATDLHNAQIISSGHFAHCAIDAAIRSLHGQPMQIRLRTFRRYLDLTLEAMAAESEFSYSQLSRWESGLNNIPSERLPALARAYYCGIGDIFADEAEFGSQQLTANYLQDWRIRAGLSVEELAEKAEVKPNILTEMEQDRFPLPLKWRRRFANALGTTAGSLLIDRPDDDTTEITDLLSRLPRQQRRQAIRVIKAMRE